MAGEKEPMGASMVNNTPAVRVLLVDDNSASLSTTIPMLELFNYQVVVAKTPLEATSILRLNHESFDLVLSDLQLSVISALDLQKQVEGEFHIPVILMCTNDSTNIPKRSLNVGRPVFIEKPPTPDDLKTIKQYAISRKKETQSLNYLKRRLLEEDDEERFGEEDYASLNPKKPKLTWTTALHNKFLEAIDAIGIDRAVPKKILEYMNVPGLTRVNIASHLQKYRIYLRRISEVSGSMKHGMPDNLNESPFRSTFFWSQLHTLASNNLLFNYANSSNLETQVQGAPISQINTSDHGEDNSNVPLVLNHPLTGLAGLTTQLGTKLNPQLNILESSYVISPSNNFTDYTTTQDNGNPSNGNQGDFGGLFDLANDMDYNEFMGLLEEGNQGDTSCFFNDDGFKLAKNMVINSNIQQGTLNTDQIVGNPLVERAVIMPTSDNINQVNEDYFVEQAHQDVITMPTLNNNDQIVENAFVEPAAVAMSNLDNVFAQQILPIENPNNVLPPQNMLAIGQEVQNFDLPNIASPVLFQDWASNNFDEFSLYGIDDLVSFLSSCDENNASNNQLP